MLCAEKSSFTAAQPVNAAMLYVQNNIIIINNSDELSLAEGGSCDQQLYTLHHWCTHRLVTNQHSLYVDLSALVNLSSDWLTFIRSILLQNRSQDDWTYLAKRRCIASLFVYLAAYDSGRERPEFCCRRAQCDKMPQPWLTLYNETLTMV